MAYRHNPKIITDKLVSYFDINNEKCTNVGKNRMVDLMGNKNFRIDTSNIVYGSPSYLDVTGTTAIAKRETSDISLPLNSTVIAWAIVNSGTSDWRTLIRGYGNDHPLLIESGGNNIGYYDNTSAGFLSSGTSITSVPNYSTMFNSYEIVFSSSSPYWSLYINGGESPIGVITDSAITNNSGFTIGSIGGFTSDPDGPITSGNGQYFGKIGSIMFYSKSLTYAERLYNYNAMKQRFGR